MMRVGARHVKQWRLRRAEHHASRRIVRAYIARRLGTSESSPAWFAQSGEGTENAADREHGPHRLFDVARGFDLEHESGLGPIARSTGFPTGSTLMMASGAQPASRWDANEIASSAVRMAASAWVAEYAVAGMPPGSASGYLVGM